MGDTLLPEIGIMMSLYFIKRSLEFVLGPNRQTTDSVVYTVAVVVTVVSGMAFVHLTFRGFIFPLFSRS
jgi:hypothetical protein